jgi:hypothetical protein
LLENFRFAQTDENFLLENILPVLTYTANIWRAVDINCYTNISSTKILRTKLTQITVQSHSTAELWTMPYFTVACFLTTGFGITVSLLMDGEHWKQQ